MEETGREVGHLGAEHFAYLLPNDDVLFANRSEMMNRTDKTIAFNQQFERNSSVNDWVKSSPTRILSCAAWIQ